MLGLDICEVMVDRVRSELELPMLLGTLPHPKLDPERFDLVTMWASLEHFHRPLETLRSVHQLLVPGGRLLVSVPNVQSASCRWFGAAWFNWSLPYHLTHFQSDQGLFSCLPSFTRGYGYSGPLSYKPADKGPIESRIHYEKSHRTFESRKQHRSV